MDAIDKRLLEILAEDARCSATDISKEVNLSIPAVNKRIARLRESGIIEKFTVQIDPSIGASSPKLERTKRGRVRFWCMATFMRTTSFSISPSSSSGKTRRRAPE